ncbi:MAG: hypothetical protein ACRDQU_14785 [Pseudonocardiaceae bacterium]
MTSARRQAKAAARSAPGASVGPPAPPELLDPDAAVWHDQRAYHQFMNRRGWSMPTKERMGVAASPASRRSKAAAGWALETGQGTRTYGEGSEPHPNWPQLRAWGLCD